MFFFIFQCIKKNLNAKNHRMLNANCQSLFAVLIIHAITLILQL